jgi:hypothetical protein
MLLVALGQSNDAGAQGSQDLKEACAASYEQGQTLRRASKLTLARAQLVVCQQTCPASLVRDCRRWSEEIDREMPRLVIRALDRNREPLSGVELGVNGELRELPAGGELRLDPGTHRLVLRVGEERHAREVVLEPREREELRVEFSVLRPAGSGSPPSADPTRDRSDELSIPAAAWALGAVGVIGLGAGAVLGIKGHVDRGDLRTRCAPRCEQDEVDAIQRDGTIAAVAAGVGAVAAGVAVWLVLDENTRVSANPVQGGMVGSIGGSF